jgi:hypothetical protein
MDFVELEGEVQIETPGAPRFAVVSAIVAAAREFFLESRAWRVAFGPVPMAAEIMPALPPDTFLVEPVEVLVDGTKLRSGEFASSNNGGIVFVNHRSAAQVAGVVAVAPTDLSQDIPDRLGYEFRDTLIHGALHRLMRVPGAEWSNGTLADYYGALFQQGKEKAATRAENGFVHNRTRTVRYGGY